MKRLFSIIISIFLFAYSSFTLANITIHINNITSSGGYYSFKLFIYPSDENEAHAVPTRLGFQFLDRYLNGINPSEQSYIQFGYYNYQSQATTWLPQCQSTLDKNKNLTIHLTSTNCNITTT